MPGHVYCTNQGWQQPASSMGNTQVSTEIPLTLALALACVHLLGWTALHHTITILDICLCMNYDGLHATSQVSRRMLQPSAFHAPERSTTTWTVTDMFLVPLACCPQHLLANPHHSARSNLPGLDRWHSESKRHGMHASREWWCTDARARERNQRGSQRIAQPCMPKKTPPCQTPARHRQPRLPSPSQPPKTAARPLPGLETKITRAPLL